MKQKFWTLPFLLALLKIMPGFFHDGMEENGQLETQGQISTQINLATPQSPMHGSSKYFSHNFMEESDFHQQHFVDFILYNLKLCLCINMTSMFLFSSYKQQ